MIRDEALIILTDKVKNANLLKHMLAVEAIMKAMAAHFGENQDKWGITGLLHDLDYEDTLKDFSRHGQISREMLAGKADEDILYAIRAHTGLVERKSLMDKAIYCADPVSGFIVAAALVLPEKKLEAVRVENLLNRFKEKHFAKGASRPQMESCAELGLDLPQFFEIALNAMKEKASELGL